MNKSESLSTVITVPKNLRFAYRTRTLRQFSLRNSISKCHGHRCCGLFTVNRVAGQRPGSIPRRGKHDEATAGCPARVCQCERCECARRSHSGLASGECGRGFRNYVCWGGVTHVLRRYLVAVSRNSASKFSFC